MVNTYQNIQDAIILGNVGSISRLIDLELEQGSSAQTILDQHLLPGMAEVGQRFKQNKMFLPQVLMSAQVMQTAVDQLKPYLTEANNPVKRETIIIGTVKGDMHDIGKNLVRIMLIGAGYQVIDLGVNVPVQRFIKAQIEHPGAIVCLSALLSSTMKNMQEVVQHFREHSDLGNTKLLIGGAPVNHTFATSIGADGYAPTATAAVEQVQSWFNSPADKP